LLLQPEFQCDEDNANCVYETQEEFTDRVTRDFAVLIEDQIPGYQSFGPTGDLVRGGPLVLPEQIYNSGEDVSAMTVVVSINMASDEAGLTGTAAVMADSGSEIFATAESLYVFSSHHESVENEPWTRILKFNWQSDSGAINFAAIGDVPGTLLNQFSADEADGLLRVTTQISNSGTGNHTGLSETGLFILEEDQGVLEFVGSMQNLALGQSVKSVRYFGDQAFVTTFQTIDPLYAIDLSDPASPQAIGHVPIPGFSSYMQFIAEDRLLTIGTNTATGFGGRAMVSLFDVGDLTSPRLIDQYNLPKYSTSQASLDHHAFGWFGPHELLAVPISSNYQDRFDDDGDGYPEAIRRVQEDALSMLRVGVNDETGEEEISLSGEIQHQAAVLRSVYINDNIYSIGEDAIRTVAIADPSILVDEVLFGDDLVDPVLPRVPFDLAGFYTAARDGLAEHRSVPVGEVMLVTQEVNDGVVELVLRSGENEYLYRGADAKSLTLENEQFQFNDGWHNELNANDVNADNRVSASDALAIINEMGRHGSGNVPVDRALRQINAEARYLDTNGDGVVTAVDALRVINYMGREAIDVSAEEVPVLYRAAADAYFSDDDEHEERGSGLF
jgi:hypothetical protein